MINFNWFTEVIRSLGSLDWITLLQFIGAL